MGYVFFVFGMLFYLSLVIGFLLGDDEPGESTNRIGSVLFLSVFMGLWLGFVWQLARVGVYVDRSGVTVKSFLRRRRYRWEDIEGFDTVPLLPESLPSVLRPFARGVLRRHPRCPRIQLVGGRQRVVTDLNGFSAATWLGTTAEQMARRLTAARPTESRAP